MNDRFIFSGRREIIDKINHFACRKQAFLFAVDFNGENGFVLTPEEAGEAGILYDIGGKNNRMEISGKSSYRFEIYPPAFESYQEAFAKVVFHLKRGDTYLLNLTFPTSLHTDLSLKEIFYTSNAPFRLCVPGHFVVFSPEIFIRIHAGEIRSFPMKGTMDAMLPEAEKRLLEDRKELFEHHTIVDLIRNDLGMVSSGVEVKRFRYIDRIHTNRGDLLQMSSEICGTLPGAYRKTLGEILFKLLPAGSVSGAPKQRTVQIIQETETHQRGFYTGIFGFFDGHSLDSAVMIRFIENTLSGPVFKSGGGITALSEIKSEYEELIRKVYIPLA